MKAFSLTLCSAILLMLSGCGGGYSGTSNDAKGTAANLTDNTSSSSGSSSTTTQADALKSFFDNHIEPSMQYCSACHVPGGIADTTTGKLFLLQPGQSDYDSFQAAWNAMGKGVESNLLLRQNSDPAVAHTGGKTWPAQSQIHQQAQASPRLATVLSLICFSGL